MVVVGCTTLKLKLGTSGCEKRGTEDGEEEEEEVRGKCCYTNCLYPRSTPPSFERVAPTPASAACSGRVLCGR